MSIRTKCRGCGSVFAAPLSLAGQAVKCPGCGQPVRVSAGGGAPPAAPKPPAAQAPPVRHGPAEPQIHVDDDSSDVTSFDMSLDALSPPSANGSGSGRQRRPAQRGGSGRTGVFSSQTGNAGASHGSVFDQATVGGSGGLGSSGASGDDELGDRMSRLYGVMTNKELGRAKRGKFTIGFMISIGVVLIVTTIGVYLTLKALREGPGVVVNNPAHSNPSNAPGGDNSGGADPMTGVGAARAQVADPDVIWEQPLSGMVAPVKPAAVSIDTAWADKGRRHAFTVRVDPPAPASGGSNADIQVLLYRANGPDERFAQVDRVVTPLETTSDGQQVFALNDTSFDKVVGNAARYRVSGFDAKGRRLFDAPPVSLPIVARPVLDRNRLTWQPHGSEADAPRVAVRVYLDAPGWEDVLIGRVEGAGALDVSLPVSPMRAPLRTVLATLWPIHIESDAHGNFQGRDWQSALVEHQIATVGSDDATPTPAGIVPVVDEAGLHYNLLPSEQAFADVNRRDEALPGDPVATSLAFRLKDDSAVQMLSAAGPPMLTELRAIPFDQTVRLAWDSAVALRHRHRYVEPIAIAIYRRLGDEPEKLIASLPLETTTYSDRDAQNGETYTYAAAITSAAAAGSPPLLTVDAWAAGVGEMPVMVKASPRAVSPPVTPDPALARLNVALGQAELAYDDTDLAAIEAADRLARALLDDPGVTLIDRGALEAVRPESSLPGSPAQVELRFVDDDQGRVHLWATDLITGEPTHLGSTAASTSESSNSGISDVVDAAKAYLKPRRREKQVSGLGYTDVPRVVVLGAIVPADQMWMYYASDDLRDDLADALRARLTDRRVLVDGDALDEDSGGFASEGRASRSAVTSQGVLLTGRTWIGQDREPDAPGLTVRAVSLNTGRVLDVFRVDKVTPMTAGALAVWAQGLELPAPAGLSTPAPAGLSTPAPESATGGIASERSPLLIAEKQLPSIHPVYRALASSAPPTSFGSQLPLTATDAVTLSVGLAVPRSLGPYADPGHRGQDDPLASVRPYVAPRAPLMFEPWSAAYAEYLTEDFEAFRKGIVQISDILRASRGPVMPRLFVRGEPIFTGSEPIAARGTLPTAPLALVTQPYLEVGVSGRPLIDYRRGLAVTFERQPYAMSTVWPQVPKELADAFLRAELYGVQDGKMQALRDPNRPPPFHQFVAAALLGDMGHSVAEGWRRNAVKVSAYVLGKLEDDRSVVLNSEGRRFAADALRILLYENDPGAVRSMLNADFREKFFDVPRGQEADTLRLLVDRLGPAGWQWARQERSIAWEDFRWRDAQEMKQVKAAMSDTLPRSLQDQIDLWLTHRDTADNPRRDAAGSEGRP